MDTSRKNSDKKVGPIVATLIIVLVLIISALYLFASRINQSGLPTDADTASDRYGDDNVATSVQAVSGTSTDIQSLQTDLNASTNGLDQQNF